MNSERFQVFFRAANAECVAAIAQTRGIIMTYGGQLILSNYVAGALWTKEGTPGEDPTRTERWVTYNAGRRGAYVRPTALALRSHPGNRGCMSLNGAQWLAAHGWNRWSILRFFYGDDIEFRSLGDVGVGRLGLLAIVAMGLMVND